METSAINVKYCTKMIVHTKLFSQMSIKSSVCCNKTIEVIMLVMFCLSSVLQQLAFSLSVPACFYFSFYHSPKHIQPPPQQALYQPLFSLARSIVQTPRQLNTQRRDTNFFSARDISRMLNKANSCIEF